MTTGTRDDERIPISAEPESLGWLYSIIEEPADPRRTFKPLIQTVAQTLRGIRRRKTCFDPSVVSFGPYHHGKRHLKPMERYKEVAVLWFIKLSDNPVNTITREEAELVYDNFVAKVPSVSSLRGCYTDKFVDKINDADFMRMMFLDGCFMLYFIRPFLDQSSDLLGTSHLARPLILRDMFLLENQIPYSVLVALKSLKPSSMPGRDWAASFIKTVFLLPPSSVVSYSLPIVTTSWFLLLCTFLPVLCIIGGNFQKQFYAYGMAALLLATFSATLWFGFYMCSVDSRFEEGTEPQTDPLHLLDLLRSELTGKGVDPSVHGTRHRNYNSRSISVLKEAGIQVRASNSVSLSLNNIKLKEGWIDSYLELPRIIIDDSTKTRLLNLAAYEMCPDGSLGKAVITSYICFLDSLIYNADDVKELRSSDIMLNRLGSDQEVVNLFRELAKNFSPDFNAYSNVTHGMERHSQRCFNRPRMWIGQFIRTHFISPWTLISLSAAISVIFLTLMQTIYNVLRYYERK